MPVQHAHSAGTLSLTGCLDLADVHARWPVRWARRASSTPAASLSIDFSCFVYVPMVFGVSGSTTGSIDPETGAFTTSGPDATSYHLSGVASKNEQLGGQSISGAWYCCNGSVAGGFSGYLPPPQPTATPSPTIPGPVASTPTATPTTTPPPVGGLASDAASRRAADALDAVVAGRRRRVRRSSRLPALRPSFGAKVQHDAYAQLPLSVSALVLAALAARVAYAATR